MRLTELLFLAAGATLLSGAARGQVAEMPPHSWDFQGFTRGYYFIAPVDFRITGVEVLQAPGGTHPLMNWAIVRFNHGLTPPPHSTGLNNDFVQLGSGFDHPAGALTPADIQVSAGDVIGIYGNTTATPADTEGRSSFTAIAVQATTSILGLPVNLFQSGMQFHLGTTATPQMQDLWSFGTSTAVKRIRFSYEATGLPGACCFIGGGCAVMMMHECLLQNGSFRGQGTDCLHVACPAPGACCLPGGNCSINWQDRCWAAEGVYTGDGTTCAAVDCPQSLTTGFGGRWAVPGEDWNGHFFDITAHNPGGITIEHWEIHSNQSVGMPMNVRVWYKQDTWVGFDGDISAWTLHGEVATRATGVERPTPVPLGGLHIPAGQTYGIRIGTSAGRLRNYFHDMLITPVLNDDVQIDHGGAQGLHFSSPTIYPRGWSGTIHYTAHAPLITGACCAQDGSCELRTQVMCTHEWKLYQGDNTPCPPAPACPEPPPAPHVQWVSLAPLPEGRSRAAGVLIGSTFYLMGGEAPFGQLNPTCWKLDLYANAWISIADKPLFQACPTCTPRGITAAAATAVGDDIYLVGGWTGIAAISRLLRYDTIIDSWQEITTDPLPTPVFANGLVTHSGKVYLVGGCSASGVPITESWIYDPQAPAGTRWTPFAGLPRPRCSVAATLIGDQIWVVGAANTPDADLVDVYDVPSRTWSTRPNLSVQRGGTGIYNVDGRPVVVGGGWSAQLASSEFFGDLFWHPAADVAYEMRSFAHDGNSEWLVKAGGWNGVHSTIVEAAEIGIPCYANCDGSTTPPILNVDDFICFINDFAEGQAIPHQQQITHYANCDGSTTAPVLNVDDFTCFINAFARGCS
jgi:hypothetical protein